MGRALAMVLEAPERFVERTFPIPAVGPDDLLLRVEMVAICGSDKLHYRGLHRHSRFPNILGHEIVGHVAAIGEMAAAHYGVGEGDRITVEPYVACRQCRACLTGAYHNCRLGRSYGATLDCQVPPHLFGGYAEYMCVVPGSKVHRIDAGVPAEAACLSSVVGNGIRWARTRGDVRLGDTVAIVGPGAQGLVTTLAARECGAAKIVVLGLSRDARRLRLAKEFGADATIDVEAEDPVARLRKLTDGAMADVVVECTGSVEAVPLGLDLVRPMGRYLLAGVNGGKPVTLVTDAIVNHELTVVGGHGQAWDVEDAVRLINSRRHPVERIITQRFPLRQVDEAMRFFIGAPPDCVRVALVPD